MVEWVIEPFGKGHDRATFCCGQGPLDEFILLRVSQYEKRRLGKTYVAVRRGEKQVLGYYTLAAGEVAVKQLPAAASRKLPKHPIPVVLLARLAVERMAQGQRLGEGLLLDALQRTLDLSASIGVYAVVVDALNDAAAAFYFKYGFEPLLDDPLHLYLPLTSIENALA